MQFQGCLLHGRKGLKKKSLIFQKKVMYKLNSFFLFSLLCFVLSIDTISGQTVSFEEDILGKWEGTGTLFGNSATFRMEWQSVLNEKYLKLNFQNQFKDKSGYIRTMEAIGCYLISGIKDIGLIHAE